MTFAAAAIPAAISALGSIGGGFLASRGNRETKIQRKQRKLIDQLLASLQGNGPYSSLFNRDFDTFQKSYVDPAKHMFKSQIAPQIQQSYISGGQQRGTGLDDTLTRAGVDLDQMLNQAFMDYINTGDKMKLDVINNILGAGSGAPPQMSTGDAFAQGAAGFLSSDAFSDFVKSDWVKSLGSPSANIQQPRKGYSG